jgi:hypothetical protein
MTSKLVKMLEDQIKLLDELKKAIDKAGETR